MPHYTATISNSSLVAPHSGHTQFSGISAQVTIFELAMAPQIGAAIVAMDHKLDAPLATLMVGLGIPLSFLTLPLWWLGLQMV